MLGTVTVLGLSCWLAGVPGTGARRGGRWLRLLLSLSLSLLPLRHPTPRHSLPPRTTDGLADQRRKVSQLIARSGAAP